MSYLSNIAMRSAGPATGEPAVLPAADPIVNNSTGIESMEAPYAAEPPAPVVETNKATEISPPKESATPPPSYLTRTAERVIREENVRTILIEEHNAGFGYSTTLPPAINVYETNETHAVAPQQNIEHIKTKEQIVVQAIAPKEEIAHTVASPAIVAEQQAGEPVVKPISNTSTPVQPVRVEQIHIEPAQLIPQLQPPVALPRALQPASTVKHDKVVIGRITVEVIANTPQPVQQKQQPRRSARKTTTAKNEFTSINKLSFGLGQL